MELEDKYIANKKDGETYQIIGAAMEVHKHLGPGLLESAYGDALEIEFGLRNIPYVREKALPIDYKGVILRTNYFADFVCFDNVIVELKTVDFIQGIYKAQLLHYLNITPISKGILFNFKTQRLEYHRYIL